VWMETLILIIIVALLILSIAGLFLNQYLLSTKYERQYKKIARQTRNKRKEYEKRKKRQFENNKLNK